MLAKLTTFALVGIEGVPVEVEVDASAGLPKTILVGLPEAAVREAVVNALIHRDLRRTGRVAVRLFSDRLEIWSPGGLPEGLSDLGDLLHEGGVSHPRNPLLAAAARSLGIGEQLGRGLPVMARTGSYTRRVEIRTSPRDVLVVVPSRWVGPQANGVLS